MKNITNKWRRGDPAPSGRPSSFARRATADTVVRPSPVLIAALTALTLAMQAAALELPDVAPDHLPRWSGFNLLEKFNGKNEPFREDDFRLIAELGFNFVRLPMDYRGWIVGGDWRTFDEKTLREIDQAVAYGKQYGIHVNLNFHRAPGYTVAKPAEAKSLWTDPEAQEVCALHWATFAKRYKGIPNRNLSFNLLNEPADVNAEQHGAAIAKLVAAIRKEDPDRLIICDARQWGNEPADELVPLRVAQATRGYQPMSITHFQASWVNSSGWARPAWPVADASGWLAGPGKKELGGPLRITGSFPAGTKLRLRVLTVSGLSRLVVRADGRTCFDHRFQPGGGTGEWKKVVHKPEWNIYQNVYDRDYTADLPAEARELVIENTEGDWMTLGELALVHRDGREDLLVLQPDYGRKPVPVTWRGGGFETGGPSGRDWLRQHATDRFRTLEQKGVGVMVGEFGAFNKTPHDVTLRWMEDCLAVWQEAGWGWALWNFRGAFGVLDSGRTDVTYEDFHGHQLDRRMLDLLQRYR